MKITALRIVVRRFLGITAALALALPGLLGAGAARAADLKLMVEPFYTPERAAEVYQPLIAYLNSATGHNIELVTSRNYHFFWRDVRQNVAVDLMLAEPPITDFRVRRFQAEPLVRMAEPTSYTLLASDQIENPTLDSLVGRSIVTMPSPSLGFALLLEFYPNPVAQPNMLSSASSWRDGIEIVFAGEADATIVPTWLKDQYPNLLPVRTSREFPGIALSASAGLDPAVRQSITDALLKLHEDPSVYEVLNELGITRFGATSAAEYAGAEQMLREFYGYQ
jgi:ABC-type phosphate/phosphonate transport system substrate-binding protein